MFWRKKAKKLTLKELEARLDADRDGLSDAEEIELGTSPIHKDTDHDGVSDYLEVKKFGSDPLDWDTDRDGISDGEEAKRGWNPAGIHYKFKDLFIPNEENNFSPKWLEPKNIFWHGVFAVALKLASVALVLALPISAWLTPDILSQQSERLVKMTNEIRSNLQLPLLKVNPQLNLSASLKSKDMAEGSYFAHTSPQGVRLRDWINKVDYKYIAIGENLAVGFSTPEGVINGWTRSKTHYANLIDPNYSEIGIGISVGKYKSEEAAFVAQHFGLPSKSTAKKSVSAVRQVKKRTNAVTVKSFSGVVFGLSEKKLESDCVNFAKPIFVYPQDLTMANQAELPVRIYSPKAERVIVFANDEAVAQSQINDGDYFNFTISTFEGRNDLSIMSWCGEGSVDGDSIKIFTDTTPPTIDERKSFISLNDGIEDSLKLSAEVTTSVDVEEVYVYVNAYQIKLAQSQSNPNLWTGEMVIYKDASDHLFAPLVMSTVTVTDVAGNKTIGDISWKDAEALRPSLKEQYEFLKKNQSPYVQTIMGLNIGYYQLLVLIVSVALILNIFIEIKRQHPRLILSGVCLIAVLSALIWL